MNKIQISFYPGPNPPDQPMVIPRPEHRAILELKVDDPNRFGEFEKIIEDVVGDFSGISTFLEIKHLRGREKIISTFVFSGLHPCNLGIYDSQRRQIEGAMLIAVNQLNAVLESL